MQREALERSQLCRNNYVLELSELRDDMLCFLDETAGNEYTLHRKYGWAPFGITPRAIRPVKRSERYSVLPAYTKDGILAYHITQGSIDGVRFEWFLRNEVLPRSFASHSHPKAIIPGKYRHLPRLR